MGFDLDTLELLSYINDLQVKLRNGSCSFSELKEPNFDNLFIYDDSKSFLEDPEDDDEYLYRIVLDMWIDENYHDIISYYDQLLMPDVFFSQENQCEPEHISIILGELYHIVIYKDRRVLK